MAVCMCVHFIETGEQEEDDRDERLEEGTSTIMGKSV